MNDRNRLPDGVRRAFRLRLRRDVDEQVAEEVDSEIRFHIESRIDELMAGGADRAEAERRATEEFGDVTLARRALRRESARTERRVRRSEWLRELVQDLRYGWRKLWAKPGFAAVAILTLALGIGANTAIFSVVHAVLLKPLPYREPSKLVQIWEKRPDGNDRNVVSRGNYLDWRDQTTAFEAIGAYSGGFGTSLSGVGDPIRVDMSAVTPSTLRILGVSPAAGRLFHEEEGLPGSASVVILSHGLWQRRFGGDPNVIGSVLDVGDESRTVIGVMPEGFDFPRASVQVWGVWRIGEEVRQSRRSHNLRVLARLKPEATIARAQAELDAIAARLAVEYPEWMHGWGVNVQPYRADLVRNVRPLLFLLLGVVALVLLLACANLANLLLARAMAREREVAVRGALGAGRGRLFRQFLTESGLIALLGGGIGFALTALGLDLFVSMAPSDIPLLDDTRIEPAVFGFAAGVTLLATFLFGLVPALRSTATNLGTALRASQERAGAIRHEQLRAGLLVAEVALSAVLVIGAGLLLRSFQQLQRVDYGYNPENVLVTELSIPSSRYPEVASQVDFYRRLVARLEAVPGVLTASATSYPPAWDNVATFSFVIEGRPRVGPREREDPIALAVAPPGLFRTLGIPLISGRTFTDSDGPDATSVLVINESFARRHWPGENPIGERISFAGHQGPWLEIVGVVGDTRHMSADRPSWPTMYVPHAQSTWDWMTWIPLITRTEGDPEALAPAIRAAIWELDATLAIGRNVPLTILYSELNARRRFATVLLAVFAALAMVLGTVGVYGVLSYSVTQRTREIGVRMALGAQRSTVAGAVVRQGIALALAGIALGVPAALGLSRFLETLVFGITTRDIVTFVAVPLLLLIVAALAAYVPARRATRVDPLQALRTE